MKGRCLLLIAALSCAACNQSVPIPASPENLGISHQEQVQNQNSPPNILFIMSDDHTAQAWGIYGGILQDYVQNEHISRLAREGAVLTKVFCTNSICVPSRGSILTGRYSHQNGIYTLSDALDPDSMTIAKALQQNGYQTAVIGKWHLKKKPAGFDHFEVLPGQGRYHDPILKTAEDWQDGNQGGRKYNGFSADVITERAISWLDRRDKDKPFFLMTHFKATHEPFDYPDRLKQLHEDREIPEPASLYDFGPHTNGRSFIGQKLDILGERYVKASQNRLDGRGSYPGLPFTLTGLDSLEARKKIYQKFVKDFIRSGAAIDENIGKLLEYLDRQGLNEHTVVIYTSDQGYFLGEHGFFDKRMIYEESLQMPFVIRYPKEIKPGTRLDDLILNIDFPALFADYAGLTKPGFVRGQSFRRQLSGQTSGNWRQSIYYRYWLHQTQRPAHFGIRTDRYKLAFFYGQPLAMTGAMAETTPPAWEFFDLEKDPRESRNAYRDPAYSKVIEELKTELLRLRKELGDEDKHRPVMHKIFEEFW